MDISGIQARISTIQSRIDQISGMIDPSSANTPQFSQTLSDAQAAPGADSADVTSPDGEPIRPLSATDLNMVRSPPLSSAELEPMINNAALKYGVDPSIVKAVIQTESSGVPTAVSSAGAMGLMQLMPSNVAESKVTDPFDPAQNIDAGVSQLSGYLKQYNGNLDQALAAYNSGPGAVEQYHGIPPFQETQNYIKKIHTLMGQ